MAKISLFVSLIISVILTILSILDSSHYSSIKLILNGISWFIFGFMLVGFSKFNTNYYEELMQKTPKHRFKYLDTFYYECLMKKDVEM